MTNTLTRQNHHRGTNPDEWCSCRYLVSQNIDASAHTNYLTILLKSSEQSLRSPRQGRPLYRLSCFRQHLFRCLFPPLTNSRRERWALYGMLFSRQHLFGHFLEPNPKDAINLCELRRRTCDRRLIQAPSAERGHL